jgi:hypothetical protein
MRSLNAGERAPLSPQSNHTLQSGNNRNIKLLQLYQVHSLKNKALPYRVKDLLVEKGSTVEIPPQSAGLFVLAPFNDKQTFPLCHCKEKKCEMSIRSQAAHGIV